MPCPRNPILPPRHHAQRGAVLMVMLVIMVMGSATLLVNSLNSSAIKLERDQVTAASLVQAKDALIGYATKSGADASCTGSNCARPGDLPCPDTDNDGDAEPSCGDASGSTGQSNRLGRLPWKTLGIPDLRDDSGERLWYAVSNSFKNNIRSTALVNSDTPGTITVRATDASILQNGLATVGTGAVAVILSPGAVLQRTDKVVPQDRSAAGVNLPENYLDIANSEDNATFTDNSENGFLQGILKDSNDATILNDQLLVITRDNMMHVIQKRIAREVRSCLINYFVANSMRYPWAVPVTTPTVPLAGMVGVSDTLFGRLPASPPWPASCTLFSSPYWNHWKDLVFYQMCDGFKPGGIGNAGCTMAAGTALTVNGSGALSVVVVAGSALLGQTPRNITASPPTTYLEGINPHSGTTPSTAFETHDISSSNYSTVNDFVLKVQ